MSLIHTLQAIVGDPQVLTQPDATAPYLTDWRKRYVGAAQAVVRPATTQQVAQVMQACVAAGAPMVPQGGNTGLVGGATPDSSGNAVLICLQRLNRIREVDTAGDTLTAEAGCILQQVQEAARAQNRLFPLSLASEGSATIGGNLSSNAGGTQVLRYGNARELALGLEVVLPDGEVWDGLRGLRKNNTGYDLRNLFIGAEGTLGIITAATLKLYPLPRAQLTAFVALGSLQAAVDLLAIAREAFGAGLTAFELMSAACVQHTVQHLPDLRAPLPLTQPWFALLELSDHESEAHAVALLEQALAQAMEGGIAADAVIAQSVAEAQALWRIREGIPEAHAKTGGNVKHDIALPVHAIPAFVSETDALLQARFDWIAPSVFGHLGDGNLHYNMGTREGVPLRVAFEHAAEINRIVHDAVHARGGSISAEHGIGQLKREELLRYKSPVELELMRSIKRALDPAGLMNPGKML